jgi:uncharacterized protein (DUF1330 family)
MSYYFIAHIKIHDSTTYQKYLDKAGAIFSKYHGEYLAVDDHPKILEGEWNYTRTVLIKFATAQDFEAWYHSKEYQEILKHRLSAAKCDTVLAQGVSE